MRQILIILMLLPIMVMAQEVGSKKAFRKVLKGTHAQFVTDDGEGVEFYNTDRSVWSIDWQTATLTYSQHGDYPSGPEEYLISEAYEDDIFLEVTSEGTFGISIEMLDGTIKKFNYTGPFTVTFDKHEGVVIYRYGDGRHLILVSDSYYKSQNK